MFRYIRQNDQLIEYNLVQTDRCSIECRVLPNEIRVFAPKSLPPQSVDAFVRDRLKWILAAVEEMRCRQAAAARRAKETLAVGIPVEGVVCPVEFVSGARPDAKLLAGRLIVSGTNGSWEQAFPLLKRLLIQLARTRFSEACAHFAPLVGCSTGRITLREQKTKWGSCSEKGNLNFNWKLIMAPPGALQYIVIHELCHLKRFDHSPEFWSLVRTHCPDADHWILFLKRDFHPPAL